MIHQSLSAQLKGLFMTDETKPLPEPAFGNTPKPPPVQPVPPVDGD